MLAAWLWLAFSTGDLDMLSQGFLAGGWERPGALLCLVPLVAAVLVLGRGRRMPRFGFVLALGLVVAWAKMVPHEGSSRGPATALMALTLDQGPFALLAAWGIRRGIDGSTWVFLVGGGGLLASAHAGHFNLDPWCGQALYRLGLLLASCGPVSSAARFLAQRLKARPTGVDPANLGIALLVAVAAPTSAVVWWDPGKLDAVASDSFKPVSTNLEQIMDWIRLGTEPEAVFVANSDYAPLIAVLGGRRVLSAPSLVAPQDQALRRHVHKAALTGRDPDRLLARYGIRYVFAGPGEWGLKGPVDAEARGLRRVFLGAGGIAVYATGGGSHPPTER